MEAHKKSAFGLGLLNLVLLVAVPYLAGEYYPDSGLGEKPYYQFGFVLGSMLLLKVILSADISKEFGFLNFCFLLTLTAMASFVTLLGTTFFSAGSVAQEGFLVLPDSAAWYFVGLILSFVVAFLTTQVIKSESDPGGMIRSSVVMFSIGIYLFYVWLMMTKVI